METALFRKKYRLIRLFEILLLIALAGLTTYLCYLSASNPMYIIFAFGGILLLTGWVIDLFRNEKFHRVEISESEIAFINLMDNTRTSYRAEEIKTFNSNIRTKEMFHSAPRRNPYLYFEITFTDGFVYSSTPSDKGFWDIKRWVEERRIRPTEI